MLLFINISCRRYSVTIYTTDRVIAVFLHIIIAFKRYGKFCSRPSARSSNVRRSTYLSSGVPRYTRYDRISCYGKTPRGIPDNYKNVTGDLIIGYAKNNTPLLLAGAVFSGALL